MNNTGEKAQHALVFEPKYTGHRLNYVRLFVEAAIRRGVKVSVALDPQARETVEFAGHLSYFADAIDIVSIDKETQSNESWLCSQAALGHYSEVHIPYGDGGVAERVALTRMRYRIFGPSRTTPISILKMRGTFAYRRKGIKRRIQNSISLKLLSSSVFSKLYLIDSLAYEFIVKHQKSLASKTVLLPDPVVPGGLLSRRNAAVKLDLCPDRKYIGLFGVIDERKGADRLLDAFRASSLSPEWSLLLAGKFSSSIQEKIFSLGRRENIVAINRFISNDELQTYFEACHFICTPFVRHIGSSSTVVRAAVAYRPVLADSYGWIGHTVHHNQLGAICDTSDKSVFASEIRRFADISERWLPTESQRMFASFHSEGNFIRLLNGAE